MKRIDREDRQDKNGHKGVNEDDVIEDDLDYVQMNLYDVDTKDAEDIRFEDFFGKPKGKGKGKGKGESIPKAKKSSSKKSAIMKESESESESDQSQDDSDNDDDDALSIDSQENDDAGVVMGDGDDNDSIGSGSSSEVENNKPKSKLDKSRVNMKNTIRELEEQLVKEKSWDLRGEAKSGDRPENSLLGIQVDVEKASKPAPLITKEYTATLEDLIMTRIKDGRFDDVVPKQAPRSSSNRNEDFELSQEKSNLGLGDIYAEEFLSKTMGTESSRSIKEKKAAEDVQELFKKVCRELDALSHFFYAPIPDMEEAKITTSNIPVSSLSMEDVLPTSESYGASSAHAPEEIMDKKRGRNAALIGDEERNSDDKKRLRRASKAVNKKKKQDNAEKDQITAKIDPYGNVARKLQEQKEMDDVAMDKRVTVASSDSGNHLKSSSSAFFSRMQENVREEIKSSMEKKKKGRGEKGGTDGEKSNKTIQSRKFML